MSDTAGTWCQVDTPSPQTPSLPKDIDCCPLTIYSATIKACVSPPGCGSHIMATEIRLTYEMIHNTDWVVRSQSTKRKVEPESVDRWILNRAPANSESKLLQAQAIVRICST